MKAIATLLFSLLIFPCFSQDSLSKTSDPKILHIATHGISHSASDQKMNIDSIGIKDFVLHDSLYQVLDIKEGTFFVLSLSVDPDDPILDNWSEYTKSRKDFNGLMVVSSKNDDSKSKFLLYFYDQQTSGLSFEASYNVTVEKFKGVYPHLYHYFNLKK